MESMEAVRAFGRNSGEYLGKLDPNTYSLRTAQCLLFEDLNMCFATLPKSGIMRNGKLFRRKSLVFRTCGKEYSLWPTPCKSDAKIILNTLKSFKNYYKNKYQDKLIYQCQLNAMTAEQSMNVYELIMGFPKKLDKNRIEDCGNAVIPTIAQYLFEALIEFDKKNIIQNDK